MVYAVGAVCFDAGAVGTSGIGTGETARRCGIKYRLTRLNVSTLAFHCLNCLSSKSRSEVNSQITWSFRVVA
jgi:hypothetical protein